MSAGVFVHGTGLITVNGRGDSASNMLEQPAQTDGLWKVDPTCLADVDRTPRLRRSGPISLMAVGAALDAVAVMDAGARRELPVFFATTDGGVKHTANFYAGIVERGPGAGSPLLFPETVYNAPASHISAALASDREYTAFVGDAGAAFTALAAACESLQAGHCEYALVVASQEVDPVGVAAYRALRLAGGPSTPPLAEAAAAVLLSSHPAPCRVVDCREGKPFRRLAEAADSLHAVLHGMQPPSETPWIPSASGSPLENAESTACNAFGPKGPDLRILYGESMAAGALAGMAAGIRHMENPENPRSLLFPCLGFQGSCCAALLTTSHATQ